MSDSNAVVTYQHWNLPYGRPLGPIHDEAEARRCFAAEESLWVLFGHPERPDVVLDVELGGRLVEVTWLDELRRPTLSYAFGQPDGVADDELSMQQTHVRAYDHDRPLPEGEATHNETWYFKPDGSFWATRGSDAGPSEQSEGRLDPEQVETLRERRPAFGEWDSLIRFER